MSDCRHDAPNREPYAGDVQTKWQQLDEQNHEERLDRLIDCLYSFDGDTDISEIDRCLEELDQVDAESAGFGVEQGLKELHERYAPAFEDSAKANKKKTVRGRRPLARIAIIAAVLCAFMITAHASGFDILAAIAQWTSEQFSFVKAGEGKDEIQNLQYASLQKALDDYGITERLSPDEFPEGTELDRLLIKRENVDLGFFATYLLDGEPFYISVRKIDGIPYGEIEINDSGVEVYLAGDIEHYIMTDVKQIKATWSNGPWECFIAGNLAKEDLRMMIDSIYE